METLVQDKEEVLKKNTVIKKTLSVHVIKNNDGRCMESLLHNFILDTRVIMLQFVSVFIICQKLHYWELLKFTMKILILKCAVKHKKLFNISQRIRAKKLKDYSRKIENLSM